MKSHGKCKRPNNVGPFRSHVAVLQTRHSKVFGNFSVYRKGLHLRSSKLGKLQTIWTSGVTSEYVSWKKDVTSSLLCESFMLAILNCHVTFLRLPWGKERKPHKQGTWNPFFSLPPSQLSLTLSQQLTNQTFNRPSDGSCLHRSNLPR